MELKDTAELMESKDYKQRFKAEYYQLEIRYEKLKKMVKNWRLLPFVPVCPKSTYRLQLDAMEKYLAILEARAKIEGVEL